MDFQGLAALTKECTCAKKTSHGMSASPPQLGAITLFRSRLPAKEQIPMKGSGRNIEKKSRETMHDTSWRRMMRIAGMKFRMQSTGAGPLPDGCGQPHEPHCLSMTPTLHDLPGTTKVQLLDHNLFASQKELSQMTIPMLTATQIDRDSDEMSLWRVLKATGMDPFEAIQIAFPRGRKKAAGLWIECLRLTPIPAGNFFMGTPECYRLPGDFYEGEWPRHKVTIRKPFFLSACPITGEAWAALMGWVKPSSCDGDSLPVEGVSWKDITRENGFLARLNALTDGVRPEGHNFRLPTEAEWEYACRAGEDWDWCLDRHPEPGLDLCAWYGWNSGDHCHPVGTKPPNPWGLYDMYGNVWEWCQDKWHDSYHGAPRDGRAWVGKSGQERIVRGGSYDSGDSECRAGNRNCYRENQRMMGVGFRVALAPV